MKPEQRGAPATAKELRALCRAGRWSTATSGAAPGYVQANVVILPEAFAFDFLLFCQRNPKPCPIVEVLEAGTVAPLSTPDADIRTDVAAYRIFRDGVLVDEVGNLESLWQDDWVTFLIGCSFSFEAALISAGILLRHVLLGINVAMYRTSLPCIGAGRFRGNLVVSMRPIRSGLVARAVEISARYPLVHGAPIHVGRPEDLGIADLARPDYGDAVSLAKDELPVFWACGVTPQAVLETSRIPFCITHAPGKMFVTDLRTETR